MDFEQKTVSGDWSEHTLNGNITEVDRTSILVYVGFTGGSGHATNDKLLVDGVQVHVGASNPPFYPTFNACILWAHNLSKHARWRLALSQDAAYGSGTGNVYLSAWQNAWPAVDTFDDWPANRRFSVLYFPAEINARSFFLEISDPANPDGYMQLGELWLGEYTELTKQILHGFSHTADGGAKTITPPGGGSYSTQPYTGGPVRQLQAEAQLTSQADRNAWATFKRQCGSGSPVWIDVFPTDSDDQQHIDHAMLGFVESREPLVNRVRSIYRSKITITES